MNISEFEVFNDYSSLMVLPIYLHNNPLGLIAFRNKEDKREYYKTILEDLLNIIEDISFNNRVNNFESGVVEFLPYQLKIFKVVKTISYNLEG